MDALELDFSRDAFGQPKAAGPADLAAVSALLEEDASSPTAVRGILKLLEEQAEFNGNVATVELLAAGTVVKVSHSFAGPPVYLEPDELRALLERWTSFLEQTAPSKGNKDGNEGAAGAPGLAPA